MSGYHRQIAILKQTAQGYTTDGKPLSGVVREETYASRRRIEVAPLNLAPLSQGRYVYAFTDGQKTTVFEQPFYEEETDAPIDAFGFALFAVHTRIVPVASASCGNCENFLPHLAEEVARLETPPPYEDEAIADSNYYEERSVDEREPLPSDEETAEHPPVFYRNECDTIEGLLQLYPALEDLNRIVENGKFVAVPLGGGQTCAFGVLYKNGTPYCLAYGVSGTRDMRPASFTPHAPFIATDGERGYWLLCQDADTGKSIE